MKSMAPLIAACAALGFITAAHAAPTPGPSNDCASIIWNPSFLRELPKAAAAGHEGEFGVMHTLTDKTMRIVKPESMPAN